MTTAICPTVCDAGLPPVADEHLNDPDEAHRVIGQARRQGPLAMGPHGPEVLSYDLVRSVLRDPRFAPVISDLIRAEDDGDRFSHRELVMLAATLLAAGTDTTRNQLAAAVYVLHKHRDQWALLGERPELVGNAVLELMGYQPPSPFLMAASCLSPTSVMNSCGASA